MPSQPARTHAQRRAATTESLLDATVQSLIEVGYLATTTRGVAERAGVSQGAQQHYFPTKAALVEAALTRVIGEQFAAASKAFARQSERSERELAELLLDRLWFIHNVPITAAAFEMFQLARNDADMAESVARVLTQGMSGIEVAATALLPRYSVQPGFTDLLQLALASMRGTVMMSAIPGAAAAHTSWPALRTQLLTLLDALAPDA